MGGKLVNSVFRVGFVVVLAHLLDPESFGLFQTVTILTGFAEVVGQVGIGAALVQVKELRKDHISTSFAFSLFWGITLSLVLFSLSDYWGSYMGNPELGEMTRVFVWIFPIRAFSIVSVNLLQRNMAFKKVSLIETISYLIGYGIVACVLAYLDFGVWSLIYATMAQGLIASFLFFVLQPHKMNVKPTKKALKELLGFGGSLTLAKIFNYLARKGDYFIISKFLGAHALGIYGRAYNIMTVSVSLFGNALDKVIYASMSRKQDDNERLKFAYLKSDSAIGFVMLPASIVAVIIGPEIVDVLLGQKFAEAVIPFQLLSATMFFRVGYKIGDSLAKATGKVHLSTYRQMMYAVFVAILAFVGVKLQGVDGASAGVAISIILVYLLSSQMATRLLKELSWWDLIKNKFSALLSTITIGGIVYAMVFFLRYNLFPSWITLLLTVSISPLLYIVLWKTSKNVFFGESGIWLVQTFANALPKKISEKLKITL